MQKQQKQELTLKEFCTQYEQKPTTRELKRKAKAQRRFKNDQTMPLREVQQVYVKKEKKQEFYNELASTFDTELNVCAKPFERKYDSHNPFPVAGFNGLPNYHTAYSVAGFNILPYVVPVNPNWKQIAGDLMYHWLFMIHGQQTGLIVGQLLEVCDIIDIRMMLQDFNLLILRGGQAFKALQERALAFFPLE